KDYIAMPKGNNYQSLHTTVIVPGGERVEFQIRSREMHEMAEHGIASHWKYKEGKLIADKDEMKFKWIRRLLDWQRELSDPAEFLDTVKLDLFVDDIYVFTPTGELKELPRGSTPVDFAYSIHTDVGHRCVGARVSGKIVPLRSVLRSGDTVEIITGKHKRPNPDWLHFVVTSRAKAKIRQYSRQEEHDQSGAIGRGLLERACTRVGLTADQVLKHPAVEKFALDASYENAEALLIPVGYGKISPQQLIHLAQPEEKKDEKETAADESVLTKLVKKLSRGGPGPIRVGGMGNMLVSFGKCCNPIVGDSIVGYVTRGRGISVHLADCPRVIGMDPERKMPVQWEKGAEITRVARLKVICVDRPGLLAAMTEAITSVGANIAAASIKTSDDKTATNLFDVEIKDVAQFRKVVKSLERVKGVISVERIRG
ncbi:MAG: bifunctional (p)ppGpp synthetase/guanosine-3',5'-bis(diphosphate) 3'-pyrophosphohydrolase, partial [Deltaproteobacteria bacterium]|nr:bifunctional (p)ppGpp synthetase/guanosine-3',5'-bis(diphosphate) 3'-pyrophosphohydrolase [Deltaproteobacteria bacterium]